MILSSNTSMVQHNSHTNSKSTNSTKLSNILHSAHAIGLKHLYSLNLLFTILAMVLVMRHFSSIISLSNKNQIYLEEPCAPFFDRFTLESTKHEESFTNILNKACGFT